MLGLSGRVCGVLVDVIGGQVVRPNGGGVMSVLEIDLDTDISAGEGDKIT
jgi:hypothetical protein